MKRFFSHDPTRRIGFSAIALLALGLFLAAGCTPSADYEPAPSIAVFDPGATEPVVPFPNDILINQETGLVNLPINPTDPLATQQLTEGLNTLDGFGNTTPITVNVKGDIDATTLSVYTAAAPGNILLLDTHALGALAVFLQTTPQPTTPAEGAAYQAQVGALFGALFVQAQAVYSPPAQPWELGSLVIQPAAPLAQSRQYVVIVSKGVENPEGVLLAPSPVYFLTTTQDPLIVQTGPSEYRITSPLLEPATPDEEEAAIEAAKSLEVLRQNIDGLWDQLEMLFAALGIALPEDITHSGAPNIINRDLSAIAWAFTTQSITDTLSQLRLALIAGIFPVLDPLSGDAMIEVDDSPVVPSEIQAAVQQLEAAGVSVITGKLSDVSFIDPNTGLFGYMPDPFTGGVMTDPDTGDPVPFNQLVKFPFLLLMPAQGAGPFPLVVFQHGLTRSHYDALALAPYFVSQGFAVVAIDAYLHGDRSTDTSNRDSSGTPALSGDGFLSDNPFATKFNMWQSVLDLVQLVRAVRQGSFAAAGITNIGPTVSYVGQSLGGILGTDFLAIENDTPLSQYYVYPGISNGVLSVPGGGLSNIIIKSPSQDLCYPLLSEFAASALLTLCEPGDTDPVCLAQEEAGLGCPIKSTTPDFMQLLATFQWILDAADPLNFGLTLEPAVTAASKRILIQKAGKDQVIPASATDALAAVMGLGPDSSIHLNISNTTFDDADHGFLLNNVDPVLTLAGQIQAAAYLQGIDMTAAEAIAAAQQVIALQGGGQ